jgi:hypothetical protein
MQLEERGRSGLSKTQVNLLAIAAPYGERISNYSI